MPRREVWRTSSPRCPRRSDGLGVEVTVMLPAYREALRIAGPVEHLGSVRAPVSSRLEPADHRARDRRAGPDADGPGAALLRPRRALRRRRPRPRRQRGAVRLLLPRRARMAARPRHTARHHPLPRLADRPGTSDAARHRRALSRAPPGATRADGAQPRLPGTVLGRRLAPAQPRRPLLHQRHPRAVRRHLVPEGRAGVRRCHHHGEPALRARDPDAGIRRRARRRPARACAAPARHRERDRLRAVESRHGRADRRALRRRRAERQGTLQGGPAAGARPARRCGTAAPGHGVAARRAEGTRRRTERPALAAGRLGSPGRPAGQR